MKKDFIQQLSLPEERETQINLDYYRKECVLYTNNATVMNRLERKGVPHHSQNMFDGKVYSRIYKSSFKDMGKFLHLTTLR